MAQQSSKYATPVVPSTTRSGVPSRVYLHELARCEFPQSWAIRPILPMGALILVSGDSKFGRKTLTLMHLAQCMSTGVPFFAFQIQQPRPVIYSFLEDSHGTVARRSTAMGYAAAPPVWPVVGTFGQQECHSSLAAIYGHAAGGGLPGIWIIDTLAELMRLHGFKDENSASEMTEALAPYREFAHYTGWSIVVTHHNRKAGDEIRGSGAIKAIVDGWVQVQWRPDTPVRQIDGVLREADPFSFGAEIRNIGTLDQPLFRFIAHASPGWEAGSVPYGAGSSGQGSGGGGGGGGQGGWLRRNGRGGGSGGGSGTDGGSQAPPFMPPMPAPPAPLPPITMAEGGLWQPTAAPAVVAPLAPLAPPPPAPSASTPPRQPRARRIPAAAPQDPLAPYGSKTHDAAVGLLAGILQTQQVQSVTSEMLRKAVEATTHKPIRSDSMTRVLRQLRTDGYAWFQSYDAIYPGARLAGENTGVDGTENSV